MELQHQRGQRDLSYRVCLGLSYSLTHLAQLSSELLKDWRFVEMFAGEGNISKCCRIKRFPGVSCDVAYGLKAMDLLTPSGMARLGTSAPGVR